jgi:hypothetical protein
MTAIIPLFLQSLPALLEAGESVASFIAGFRQAAQQSGEWTDANEAAFQAAIAADDNSQAWQPDPPKTV